FVLNFDKNTSIYKEEEKLSAPTPNAGGVRIVSLNLGGSGNGSIYFKNIQEKRYAHKTEIQGKVFLVKDKLPNIDWQLTSETKNIGQYTCYKATFTEEVEKRKMSIVNDEPKEEITKEIKTTTAWYTPQIPISNGPDDYQGLPGLILEINDGKTVMICSEIIMNPSEKVTITEPTKGKQVDEKTYVEIQRKKSEEMINRMKSKNGIELGNGATIKIGN
ncbi:GLPGLI family protein, partial [Polaribacter sp.]|nr:GLPGLI family protein [Polaribacter sp.]